MKKTGVNKMNDKKEVSFIAFEAEMTRKERHIRRLWVTILALIGATVITNLFWIIGVVLK